MLDACTKTWSDSRSVDHASVESRALPGLKNGSAIESGLSLPFTRFVVASVQGATLTKRIPPPPSGEGRIAHRERPRNGSVEKSSKPIWRDAGVP